MKFFSAILLLAFPISGCNSCLSKLYGVHEKQTPINVTFEHNLSSSLLNRYIDSLNQNEKRYGANCIPTQISIDKNDKVFCFSVSPCECYLLSINENKVIIQAVYIPHVNSEAWLTKREQVNDTVLHRVELRFRNEILNKL
jgi:ferredoxin-thioredoxin reductase catalytic subunit